MRKESDFLLIKFMKTNVHNVNQYSNYDDLYILHIFLLLIFPIHGYHFLILLLISMSFLPDHIKNIAFYKYVKIISVLFYHFSSIFQIKIINFLNHSVVQISYRRMMFSMIMRTTGVLCHYDRLLQVKSIHPCGKNNLNFPHRECEFQMVSP